MNFRLRGLFSIVILSLLFLSSTVIINFQKNILAHQIVAVGEPIGFKLALPERLLNSLEINVQPADSDKRYTPEYLDVNNPVLNKTGNFNVEMRLFGLIPLRQMAIDVVKPIKLLPGGQSIGIMMHLEGVIVAGFNSVLDQAGNERHPASGAGIKVGDIILKINGQQVKGDFHAQELIEKAGAGKNEATFEIIRDKESKTIKVHPVLCGETGRYRVGLYIRDGAAGVGTLTFYEPKSMVYGALGHVIADAETSDCINLANGCIVNAPVQTIHPGKRGQPGEKIGVFGNEKPAVGNIEKNTSYGIFGHLENEVYNPLYPEPIPVLMGGQVREGPAEILTVLENEKIERFTIEIQRVNPQVKTNGRDLVIKINDENLLGKTGGIIQGMSGSPIIQNGKLVGAVTHVFINDPQRGYGILAERMLKESGILNDDKHKMPRASGLGIFL